MKEIVYRQLIELASASQHCTRKRRRRGRL